MLSPDEDAIRMFQRGNSRNQAATRRKLSANSVFQCLISSDSLAVVVDQRTRALDQSADFLGIYPNRRDRQAHRRAQHWNSWLLSSLKANKPARHLKELLFGSVQHGALVC